MLDHAAAPTREHARVSGGDVHGRVYTLVKKSQPLALGGPNAMTEPPVLILRADVGERREFALDEMPITIGRDASAGIVLDGEYVSRVHARVERDGVDYFLADAGSRNGTFLNGKRVDVRQRLASGDEIRVGEHSLTFVQRSLAGIDVTRAMPNLDALRAVAVALDDKLASAAHSTAIILFCDIVDSTALTEQLGDSEFRRRARVLVDSLDEAVLSFEGRPIEGRLLGDGTLAVFQSARSAIECALRCATTGDHQGLALHVGVHAGDVIREDGNIYGGAVNIAARISSLAGAGEVLVSGTVRELARTSAGVSFTDRGLHGLKGVADAVHVWAVTVA
jgi:class 3 adenylate cyclase